MYICVFGIFNPYTYKKKAVFFSKVPRERILYIFPEDIDFLHLHIGAFSVRIALP